MSATPERLAAQVAPAELPRDYNAAVDFVDGNLERGLADKTAVIDEQGSHTYATLAERCNRAGNALRGLDLRQEDRVAMLMPDNVLFPAVFWGAIKAGLVPIPVNTLLTSESYAHILRDSRARALVISETLWEQARPALDDQPFLDHVIVDGTASRHDPRLAEAMAEAPATLDPAPTTPDDVAFWLYSSGSTGAPKGVRHLHRHLRATSDLYAARVLGIREDDVVFSAAKLFFAYGLGNGMTFPFSVGATAVYLAGRPTPEAVMEVMRREQPTIYCGVPTLYAAILADQANGRESGSSRLRRCISAGEPLPEEVGKRWEARFGAPILDGVGSTEMLHIYLSNQPGDVRYGTSGRPVPGYEARLVDEDDRPVAPGEVGELLVKGPSAAEGYWNQRQKSLQTFQGPWTRTGDKYYMDDQGIYHYCGRTDDMIKVSGNWVSPFEVESALMEHEAVYEAAVIAHRDGSELVKPKAYVVLHPGAAGGPERVDELQAFVKQKVGVWKYPRWIEFLDELPKTATGKIQRFRLRQLDREQE